MNRSIWGASVFVTVLSMALFAGVSPVFALQDPTRPPDNRIVSPDARPVTPLELQSILVGEARRVAVINGLARSEGQGFDGIRVLRIHDNRVDIVDHGRARVLYLDQLPQVRGTQ